MSLANNLMEILEISDSPVESPPLATIPKDTSSVVVETGDQLLDDLEFARNNIRNLIETSVGSLAELKAIAQSSEHPRAYEVLSTLLTTAVNLNKDLIDIHKKKKDLLKDDTTISTGSTNLNVKQAVFVGSTTDLARIIRDEQEKQKAKDAEVLVEHIPEESP